MEGSVHGLLVLRHLIARVDVLLELAQRLSGFVVPGEPLVYLVVPVEEPLDLGDGVAPGIEVAVQHHLGLVAVSDRRRDVQLVDFDFGVAWKEEDGFLNGCGAVKKRVILDVFEAWMGARIFCKWANIERHSILNVG